MSPATKPLPNAAPIALGDRDDVAPAVGHLEVGRVVADVARRITWLNLAVLVGQVPLTFARRGALLVDQRPPLGGVLGAEQRLTTAIDPRGSSGCGRRWRA